MAKATDEPQECATTVADWIFRLPAARLLRSLAVSAADPRLVAMLQKPPRPVPVTLR